MNWKDYQSVGFKWSMAAGVLVMGPLDDGRIIVHEEGSDPFCTFKPIEQVKSELEAKHAPPPAPATEPTEAEAAPTPST